MKVIGVRGLARAGKDTFVTIAKNILIKNGYTAKQYSFAEQLKKEVEPFLKKTCGVDVWTNDSEIKKDIRDFLVWYGTTFWRKRDPKRWIRGVDNQIKSDGTKIDFALVSDVRYPNEGEWVHSWNGYLVHVEAYKDQLIYCPMTGQTAGATEKKYFEAPNEQEEINDPIVKAASDYKLEWRAKGLTQAQAAEDKELQTEVLKALNACDCFTDALYL